MFLHISVGGSLRRRGPWPAVPTSPATASASRATRPPCGSDAPPACPAPCRTPAPSTPLAPPGNAIRSAPAHTAAGRPSAPPDAPTSPPAPTAEGSAASPSPPTATRSPAPAVPPPRIATPPPRCRSSSPDETPRSRSDSSTSPAVRTPPRTSPSAGPSATPTAPAPHRPAARSPARRSPTPTPPAPAPHRPPPPPVQAPVPRRPQRVMPTVLMLVAQKLERVAAPVGHVHPQVARRGHPRRLTSGQPQPALPIRMLPLLLTRLALRHLATNVQDLVDQPEHLPLRRDGQAVVANVAPAVPLANRTELPQCPMPRVIQLRAVVHNQHRTGRLPHPLQRHLAVRLQHRRMARRRAIRQPVQPVQVRPILQPLRQTAAGVLHQKLRRLDQPLPSPRVAQASPAEMLLPKTHPLPWLDIHVMAPNLSHRAIHHPPDPLLPVRAKKVYKDEPQE